MKWCLRNVDVDGSSKVLLYIKYFCVKVNCCVLEIIVFCGVLGKKFLLCYFYY